MSSNLAVKYEEQDASGQPPTDTALPVYREILTLEIKDQDGLGRMTVLVKSMKEGIKGIKEWFKPLKESAAKAHKDICTRENETLAPFLEAEKTGQSAINVFLNEERKRQEAEERRLREEAAAKAQAEKEKITRSAAALEASGATTAAAALRQEAERMVEAPVFAPDAATRTVRADGATMSTRTETVVQVTDRKAFLRYLVEKDSAATFIEYPVKALTTWVKSNGLKNGEVPGLLIEERLASSIR